MTGALLAGLAVTGLAAPASAASGDVSAATLDWGVKTSFRTYITGPIASGTVETEGGATTVTGGYRWAAGTGSYAVATGAADISYPGAVHFSGHAGALDVRFADPRITLSGDGTGALLVHATSKGLTPGSDIDATVTLATLSGAVPTVTGQTASFSAVAAALTTDGAAAFAGFYPAGTALDPLSFSIPFEAAPVAVATTTTLAASPTATAAAGDSVTLTATVGPAAAGTVVFSDGSTAIGSPVVVRAGVASLATSSLVVGNHSITAVFTPTDASTHLGSTSSAVAYSISPAGVPSVPTTTTVAVSPASPVVTGTPVTATATVAGVGATGTVQFTDVAPNGTETALGSAPVVSGSASLVTSALSGGGHVLRADFVPAAGFGPSTGSSASYGVVNTSTAAVPTPGGAATSFTGITANWDYSAYSSDWVKTATGDITVAGQTFTLANGVARSDSTATQVRFTGSLRVTAYPTMGGFWVQLTDPTLTIAADGHGSWTADVTTVSSPTPQRLTVATFHGAAVPNFRATGTSSIAFDYVGATAQGTWSARYSDAWPNAFVLTTPASIRSFYYRSSDSDAQARKPASPLALSWTAANDPRVVKVSSDSVVQGGTLTITGDGYLAGETVTGTVYSDPVPLGAKAASALGSVTFTWVVPADFEAGAHTVELVDSSGNVSRVAFTITAAASAEAAAAGPVCVARVVSAATLDWGVRESFRTYVTGPIANGSISTSGVANSGSSFGWTGGSGSLNTDALRGRVAYSGSVSFTGHAGQLDLTIANPQVRLTGPGSAAIVAHVTSKALSGADFDQTVTLATLALPGGTIGTNSASWSNVPATLTAAGAQAFGGFYPAGAPLDPVSFRLPLGATTDCDDFTTASLASTGGSVEGGWIAGALLLLGVTLVIARRRRGVAFAA